MPVDYHAWTHRPKAQGGTDPIELGVTEWARREKTAAQTIANGTNDTEVLWVDADLDGSDGHTSYFSIVSPTDKTLRVLQDGIYEITCELQWSSNKVEGSVVSLVSTGASGAFTWNKGWYDEQNAGHSIEHTQTFTYRRRLEANSTLTIYVVHFASASRNIDAGWWEIHHVGPYSGTAPTF